MGLLDGIFKRFKKEEGDHYEFCPRCNANLTLQKGYDNNLPYWVCLGCGEMLINPTVESETDIVWICDECGAMLNTQDGFDEKCGDWKCTKCGFINKIDCSELYESDEEYKAELKNPYRGLSDEDVLELSQYEEVQHVETRDNIIVVEHRETKKKFVKKILNIYDKSILSFIINHPIQHMPHIVSLHEGTNSIIVIEEYIEGETVADMIDKGALSEKQAVYIAWCVCKILHELHTLETPIIHRDVKPANIIITPENEVFLLDMNVAKWFDPEQIDDTRYLGTQYYAAPEQVGYGLKASSEKTDVYAVGVLLNVMITQHIPKEERASGKIWKIIEKCTELKAEDRYSSSELCDELEKYEGNRG